MYYIYICGRKVFLEKNIVNKCTVSNLNMKINYIYTIYIYIKVKDDNNIR